jgi:FkbM family methyltransferase
MFSRLKEMRDRIVYKAIKQHVREKGVFYDIGCHDGRYSIPFIRTNTVYGFEPNPGRKHKGFQVFKVALGKEEKLAKLYLHKKDYYSSIREEALKEKLRKRVKNIHMESVMMVKLDDFIREWKLEPPDVIKIDVQGGEYDVLCGAYQTLVKCRPVLIVEVHTTLLKYFGHSFEELKNFLTGLDYTYEVLKHRGKELHLLATLNNRATVDFKS